MATLIATGTASRMHQRAPHVAAHGDDRGARVVLHPAMGHAVAAGEPGRHLRPQQRLHCAAQCQPVLVLQRVASVSDAHKLRANCGCKLSLSQTVPDGLHAAT